jgi:hypothetical protein
MLQGFIGALSGIGLFFILVDFLRVPLYRTSKAAASLSKTQNRKTSGIDTFLKDFAMWVSKKLRLNEYRLLQLETDLQTARMNITPELYTANAVVKAALIGIFIVPVYFLLPLFTPIIIMFSIYIFQKEYRSVSLRIKAKRAEIEYELPRLVFTIDKILKHNRDVIYMLESYRENAGAELKHELNITIADMRSGNYEAALTRLEARVGSTMMSDICRGLISVLRGDETAAYWTSLTVKFSDIQRQLLRTQAQKVPGKVRKLSLCLLVCFMLVYIVVICTEIISSLGVIIG